MGVYFGATEIIGLYFGDTEITGLYFGDTEIWAAWGEYDGALPAQYSANGDYLADYRIYGASGGVGDRTINVCRDVFRQGTLGGTATNRCILIPCLDYTTGDTYAVKIFDSDYKFAVYGLNAAQAAMFNAGGFVEAARVPFDSGWKTSEYIFETSDTNVVSITVMVSKINNANVTPEQATRKILIAKGSTAPAEYVPYGYEVDMRVSDGATTTTTPIYIGSSPLNAYEYIDYASGKIVRRTDNLIPPAPAFETTDRGITISTGGDGVYRISGTADSTVQKVQITLPIPQFSEPLSVAEGGNGAMNFFNAPMDGVIVRMEYDNNNVRQIELSSSYESAAYTHVGNNVQNVYVIITGGQTVNGTFSLMITETGSIPQTYDPYVAPVDPPVPLPALPTVDGVNIVNYAGQSAAPTEFYAKYRKG